MLYTQSYLGMQEIFLYYIPLFILLFGLIYILVRLVVKVQDPVMNVAITAFTTSLAYFLVVGQEAIQRWFFWHRRGVFITFVIIIISVLIYFVLRI